MINNYATFANFICRFGDKYFLLDYLEEIVLPAFLDDKLVRELKRSGSPKYYFYETKLVRLEEKSSSHPILAIFGQFVKDVSLNREQVSESGKLIQDSATLLSSPSAYFLLIINNHHLIYAPKTSHAPNLSEFDATVSHFMRRAHKYHIDRLYNNAKNTSKRETRNKILIENPQPDVDIVPIPNQESISNFLTRFEKLQEIDFVLLKPNPAITAEESFKGVREAMDKIRAEKGKLIASNRKNGLDRNAAATVIEEATSAGNQDLTLRGVTSDGSNLQGSNRDFQIKAPIPPHNESTSGIIGALFKVYNATFKQVVPKVERHIDKFVRLAQDAWN